MQPMSDVPAAALWVLAAATIASRRRRSPLLAGLAVSAAIVVRPNLLPMGIVIGVFLLLRAERRWRERATDAVMLAAGALPGCLLVAAIQAMLYGSPLRSGYGALSDLFSIDHIVPNAIRYATWMWQSHGPVWLLALAAPLVLPGWLTTLLMSLVLVNVACYLPYAVFNDWWYLRFMLPAIAILLVLAVASIDGILSRTQRVGAATLALVTLASVLFFIREARDRNVFALQRLEARYERAGLYIDSKLPSQAVIITSWESGSARYYGHRNTLVWDALDPAWLDRALAFLRMRGHEPYLLFERWEEPLFRQRFAGNAIGRLDWPPAVEIAGQVRLYRPDDRERYLKGEGSATEYAR
jgi:hypothetical protein